MLTLEKLKELNPTIDFNESYLKVFDTLDNTNNNLFISGNAGCGKSTLLKIIRQRYEDEKNIVVTAMTGVASALLCESGVLATTLHRFLRCGVKSIWTANDALASPQTKELLQSTDFLIVDEVSMMSVDFFEFLLALLEYCEANPRLIFFGDILQLPPVITSDVKKYYNEVYNGNHYFFSSTFYKESNFTNIILEKVYRQKDGNFKDILNRMREGKLTNKDYRIINSRCKSSEVINEYKHNNPACVTLCSTNKTVQELNEKSLRLNNGKLYNFESIFTGNFKSSDLYKSGRYPDFTNIKIGMPVMITRNEQEVEVPSYVNGDIGILVDVDDDEICVSVKRTGEDIWLKKAIIESKEVEIKKEETTKKLVPTETVTGTYENYPIIPYTASTFHKSQGQTLVEGIIDLSSGWYPENSLYVAFSRFTSLEGILLTSELKPRFVTVNKEAIDFLDYLKSDEVDTPKMSKDEEMIMTFIDSCIDEILETKKQYKKSDIYKMIRNGIDFLELTK